MIYFDLRGVKNSDHCATHSNKGKGIRHSVSHESFVTFVKLFQTTASSASTDALPMLTWPTVFAQCTAVVLELWAGLFLTDKEAQPLGLVVHSHTITHYSVSFSWKCSVSSPMQVLERQYGCLFDLLRMLQMCPSSSCSLWGRASAAFGSCPNAQLLLLQQYWWPPLTTLTADTCVMCCQQLGKMVSLTE